MSTITTNISSCMNNPTSILCTLKNIDDQINGVKNIITIFQIGILGAAAALGIWILANKNCFSRAPNDLISACQSQSLSTIRKIYHKKPEAINTKNAAGNTPLIEACIAQKNDVVKFLLDQKDIKVDDQNLYGQTALSYAYATNQAILQLLLDHLSLSKVDIDSKTSDLYRTSSSLARSAKSFIHLILLPVHALYVTVKSIIYIAIDLGKTALRTFKAFPSNFTKYGFLSSAIFFAESLVYNSTKSLTFSLWKIVRVPLYISGMASASIYGIIFPTRGITQMNNIAYAWEESTLLRIIGLEKVQSLSRSA